MMILILAILTACGNSSVEEEFHYKVNDFSFTNQDGKTVKLDDLKGKVWIADFMFTSCTSVCPPMTHNMTEIQKKLKEEGVTDYQIVSFSVDPEVDTPAKMKEYISRYEADQSKWDLLTGYSQDEISKFAEHSFKSLVADDPNSDQVVHGISFYLVNQQGVAVKDYPGNSDVPYDEIVKDVKTLIKSGTE
jgi:protein SCO1/2